LVYLAILTDWLPLELCSAPYVPADPQAQIYFILLAALEVENVKELLFLLVKGINQILVGVFWFLDKIALNIFSRALVFD